MAAVPEIPFSALLTVDLPYSVVNLCCTGPAYGVGRGGPKNSCFESRPTRDGFLCFKKLFAKSSDRASQAGSLRLVLRNMDVAEHQLSISPAHCATAVYEPNHVFGEVILMRIRSIQCDMY